MDIIKNKTIAIVGGGPGGLTLARLLQLKGANVKVYERDINKNARVQGATLDLHHDSGLLALQEAGLMDAFKANYRPGADRVSVMDKNANLMLDEHVNETNEMLRPEIDRGPLRKLLLDSLKPETVVWDSLFAALVPLNDGWTLQFQNGTSAYADVVIGADGANSKIRPYITDIKPFYTGITIVEGIVYDAKTTSPGVYRLLRGGKIFAMGDSRSLIVSSKGDGSMVFYTGCKTTENWANESGINFSDKAQVINWFKTEYTTWNNIWLELFENAAPHFMVRPQYCMPPDQTWETLPNITLLGDAAHLMPPYAGEGVNMAMLDALELSKCLTNGVYPDTQSAFAAYENHMRARASATAEMTLASTGALHAPGAVQFLIDVMSGHADQPD